MTSETVQDRDLSAAADLPTDADVQETFSARIRRRTQGAHAGAEGDGLMQALFRGELTTSDLVAMTTAHWFVYQALEESATDLANDPLAGPLVFDALRRLPGLAADLEYLLGPDWRTGLSPSPVTARYADRIRRSSRDHPGGYLAHAYTRYLGDLSGGQMIARRLVSHFGLVDGQGVQFYNFKDLGSPGDFKKNFRILLDDAQLTETEQDAVIAEVLVAYELNVALFDELNQARLNLR